MNFVNIHRKRNAEYKVAKVASAVAISCGIL